jgi:hypothetical protein
MQMALILMSFSVDGSSSMTMFIEFIIIFATIFTLPMVLWLDGRLNRKDDFLEVEEWHNFQSKMGKK